MNVRTLLILWLGLCFSSACANGVHTNSDTPASPTPVLCCSDRDAPKDVVADTGVGGATCLQTCRL